MKLLSPILLVTLLATTVAGDMVQAKAWRREGQTCLLVTNPDKEPRTATIKLDKAVTGCEGATGTVDARVEAGAVQISLPPVSLAMRMTASLTFF